MASNEFEEYLKDNGVNILPEPYSSMQEELLVSIFKEKYLDSNLIDLVFRFTIYNSNLELEEIKNILFQAFSQKLSTDLLDCYELYWEIIGIGEGCWWVDLKAQLRSVSDSATRYTGIFLLSTVLMGLPGTIDATASLIDRLSDHGEVPAVYTSCGLEYQSPEVYPRELHFVRSGDTLSNIIKERSLTEKYRYYRGRNKPRAMLALYLLNYRYFMNGDPNIIMAGDTFLLPSFEDIDRMPLSEESVKCLRELGKYKSSGSKKKSKRR